MRGVKTNIPFLLQSARRIPTFSAGDCTTTFIDDTPELFEFPRTPRPGHASCCSFIGEAIVNGNPLVKDRPVADAPRSRAGPRVRPDAAACRPGTRDKFRELGAEKFAQWILEQKPAADHRHDISRRRINRCWPPACARTTCCRSPKPTPICCRSCSRWRCGAARRSTPRCGFSRNAPGSGSARLRERVPEHPVSDAAAGLERGRIHELSGQRRAGVRRRKPPQRASTCSACSMPSTGAEHAGGDGRRASRPARLCEAAICYTGDILDPRRTEVQPQVLRRPGEAARKAWERTLLAIKDMAGLCKPEAAQQLVRALKQEIGICRSTSTRTTPPGIQAASSVAGCARPEWTSSMPPWRRCPAGHRR